MTTLKNVDPGQYYHTGLGKISESLASKLHINRSQTFKIIFHIDVIPFVSPNIHGWTILGKIKDVPTLKPFIVGLYVGKGIPENFDLLLEDLAKDIEIGQNEGFKVSDHIVIRYEHLFCTQFAMGLLAARYYSLSLKF